MRKITKNPEPKAWETYRKTENARYKPIPELVRSLLDEQGYICAYCERRIPCRDAEKGTKGAEDHRIEHLEPQEVARETDDNSDLDYNNMVICCPGNIAQDGESQYHCDKKKEDKPLKISPLNAAMTATITFTSSGRIGSSDRGLDNELGENGLNLNIVRLRSNRRETWLGVINSINKRGWTKAVLNQTLEDWKSKHPMIINGETVNAYHPYCSMVIYMLKKRLRQYNSINFSH